MGKNDVPSGTVLAGSRRSFLKQSATLAAATAVGAAALSRASTAAEAISQRYPDPLIEVLDDSFMNYRVFNAGVERLATGLHWPEARYGPVTVVTCCSAMCQTTASCGGTRSATP